LPSTKRYDLVQKQVLYRRAGVREYWIVDLGKRELRISEFRDEAFVPVPLRQGFAISNLLKGLDPNSEMVFEGIKVSADTTKQ
jgi:Uma2 family endonuclease